MIYFVQAGDDGPIKIGSANSPEERIRHLATGSAIPLRMFCCVSGGFEAERKLHARFSHLRIRREWFRPSSEILSHIAGLKDSRDQCQPTPLESEWRRRKVDEIKAEVAAWELANPLAIPIPGRWYNPRRKSKDKCAKTIAARDAEGKTP